MQKCRNCGELLRMQDLTWREETRDRFGGYYCSSSQICMWRRKRNFDKRQLLFNF